MNRRQALTQLVASAVGAAAVPRWVESLSAQARTVAHMDPAQAVAAAAAWKPQVLTSRQNDAVIALSELIIPATDTPGAKAALVNRFIDRVLSTAQTPERTEFLHGLDWMDARCRARFGKDVAGATDAQLTALLTTLSEEGTHTPEDAPGVAFFKAMKSMTISGYYTTEIGLRQELGEDGRMVLAAFEGCTHPEHQ